jgi:hypothetical protein
VATRVKKSENGRLVQFWKRTDRWCAFGWSICDKNCHIVRSVEGESFQGYIGIHESWRDFSEKEQWAKITLTEGVCRTLRMIVSKNHSTAAQVTAELNILHEDPVSTKTVRCELTNPTSIVGLQLINVCLESNTQTHKWWCHDHKTWTAGNQASGNGHMIWSGKSSFTLFPTPGRVYVWRTHKEAYNLKCLPGSNSEPQGRVCW